MLISLSYGSKISFFFLVLAIFCMDFLSIVFAKFFLSSIYISSFPLKKLSFARFYDFFFAGCFRLILVHVYELKGTYNI